MPKIDRARLGAAGPGRRRMSAAVVRPRADAHAEKRRDDRRALIETRAHLVTEGESYACVVADLSYRGALVRSALTLPVGAVVALDMPEVGVITSRVVRRYRRGMGLEFDSETRAKPRFRAGIGELFARSQRSRRH